MGAGETVQQVRVSILGALELTVNGSPVAVARPQVRKVLGMLAAHAGRSVTSDALIDHLWPDRLPQDPRATLRVNLSRLRSVLGAAEDALASETDSHRLAATTDLGELEAVLAQARAAESSQVRVDLLAPALQLWRGTPFEGIDESPTFVAVRSRAEEARSAAVAVLAQARLDLGQNGQVIELLTPFCSADPHRERLTTLLARALAVNGRKSEALTALDRCRSALRNDYGLEVSPALAALEQEILGGAVDLTRVDSHRATGLVRTFLGRTTERAQLAALGAGTVVIIGEPGIGKTALVEQAIVERAERGQTVIRAAAPQTPARAMELVGHLISALLTETRLSVEDRNRLPPTVRASLARVLPSLGITLDSSTASLPREAFVEALCDFILSNTAPNSVLVIDDVQWADPISSDVIRRVSARATLSMIVVSRPATGTQAQLLQALGEGPSTHRMKLGPLPADEVAEVVAGRLTQPPAHLTEQLGQQSGGNPLFLNLLLDVVAEGGQLDDGLPVNVLVAVQQRLRTLSQAAIESLQIAAVFGPTFSIPLASQLRPSLPADLGEAIAAGLVAHDVDDGIGRFVHALVAAGVYQMLAEGQRASLHDQACELLQESDATALAQVEHADKAAQIDPHRAIATHLAAATELEDGYQWQQIVQHCERTRELLLTFEMGHAPWLADLALAEGRALRALEDSRSRTCLVEAAELARQVEDFDVFAEATLELCSHGPASFHAQSEAEDYSSLLEEALTHELPDGLRAQLQAAGGTYFSLSTSHWRTRELFSEAYDLALASDDFDTKAGVLIHTRRGFSHPADFDRRREAIDELRRIAGEDVSLQYECALIDFTNAQVAADRALLDDAMTRIRDLEPRYSRNATRYVQGYPQFERAYFESAYALANGDFDEAEKRMMALFEIPDRGNIKFMESGLGMSVFGALLFSIRAEQGRLAELKDTIDGLILAQPEITTWYGPAAAIAAVINDHDMARSALDVIFADEFAALPPDVSWTGAMKICAEPVAMLSDADMAQRLYDALLPYRGRMSWNGMCHMGPIDHALAVTAEVLGNTAAAAEHWVAANDLATRFLPLDKQPG